MTKNKKNMENKELRAYRFDIVTKIEEFCGNLKSDLQLMDVIFYAEERGYEFKHISAMLYHLQDIVEKMEERIKEFTDENVKLK